MACSLSPLAPLSVPRQTGVFYLCVFVVVCVVVSVVVAWLYEMM